MSPGAGTGAWRPSRACLTRPTDTSEQDSDQRTERSPHADPPDRLSRGVGSGPAAVARQGEGAVPGARRHGCRTPAHALAGRREDVPLRRAGRTGEPAGPVRGAPATDRVPRLLRARGARLAGPCLRWLLDGG